MQILQAVLLRKKLHSRYGLKEEIGEQDIFVKKLNKLHLVHLLRFWLLSKQKTIHLKTMFANHEIRLLND